MWDWPAWPLIMRNLVKPLRMNSSSTSFVIVRRVSNWIEIVPGKLRVVLQTPYLMGGAMRVLVFLAASWAMYSGCMLSVHKGKWIPCSSTLPMGMIMTLPFLAACSASFMVSSSNQIFSFIIASRPSRQVAMILFSSVYIIICWFVRFCTCLLN